MIVRTEKEMKFCKKYQEYMECQEKENLPVVGFKNLKKVLKKCRQDIQSHTQPCSSDHCEVCDGTFFPSLLSEMSEIVGCFNNRAQRLLQLHLASGLRKYFVWIKRKLHQRSHVTLIQEGKDLVTYALINAVAVRKILKKYDKIHDSKQGQAFKSKAQRLHIEILQSPWLCELMAFHINLRETDVKPRRPMLFEGCSLEISDGKPSLTCELFDSVKIDIELTCSICLDTVFDPVALTCGHIFCFMCACSAASVTIVDGLKYSDHKAKCPLCRAKGVYEGSVHLEELSILLSRSCREYWVERLRTERVERLRQAKEHWEAQCRAFMGV